MRPARTPRPIVLRPDHPLHDLLLDAARLEPPAGAQARVLQQVLQREPRRLVEQAGTDDPLATLLSSVAIPDPLPAQRARVLRALGPVAPTRRWLPVWGTLGATAAAALMLWLQPRPETPPTVARIDPPAVVAAAVETPTFHRQRVDGLGELVWSADAGVEVERDDASGARLRLSSGRLALSATSRRGRGPLVIVAPGVEVEIVGTVLAVDVTGPAPIVTVGEGLVEVRHGGQTIRIGAGERWSPSKAEVSDDASGWAAWAMRLVGSDRSLKLEDVRDLKHQPPPAARSRMSRPTASTAPRSTSDALDLGPLARQHTGMPAEEMERRIADARTSFDRRSEAVWLRALADAPDASSLQVRTALVELATLLDDELARPLDALEIRRVVAQRFTTLRGEARLQIMLAASELRHPEAKEAIEGCLQACDDTARSFARFLLARQLQLDGHLTEAEEAMDTARLQATELGGAERLAELFFLRARHFLQRGQLERAQGAASVCRAFDQAGLHTAQLRQQGL